MLKLRIELMGYLNKDGVKVFQTTETDKFRKSELNDTLKQLIDNIANDGFVLQSDILSIALNNLGISISARKYIKIVDIQEDYISVRIYCKSVRQP